MTIGISASKMPSLTVEDLLAFLETRQAENSGFVEYKETFSALPNKPPDDATSKEVLRAPFYREFLKDVSALANKNGGLLVIGAEEPSEDLEPKDQLVGWDKAAWGALRFPTAEALVKTLQEICAQSLDPRIPDLRFALVTLPTDRFALVVRTSESPSKPHMVNHRGEIFFYIRHQESVRVMTAEEIRSAVLDTATAEGQARAYCLTQERRVTKRHEGSSGPLLLMQAIPLARVATRWDPLSEGFAHVVRGHDRERRLRGGLGYETWSSSVVPTPILEGVLGRDGREDPAWESEIHRTGYIHVWNSYYWEARKLTPNRVAIIPERHAVHLRAFASLLEESWTVAKEDPLVLLRCAMYRAGGTVIYLGNDPWEKFHGPCNRDDLPFEEIVRQPGTPVSLLIEGWIRQLYHGFELHAPAPAPVPV